MQSHTLYKSKVLAQLSGHGLLSLPLQCTFQGGTSTWLESVCTLTAFQGTAWPGLYAAFTSTFSPSWGSRPFTTLPAHKPGGPVRTETLAKSP